MIVKLVAFGIAKEILSASNLALDMEVTTIRDLKNNLTDLYPDFDKLSSLKFAVNEDYQSDDYVIKENDEVVIIPPVSGG